MTQLHQPSCTNDTSRTIVPAASLNRGTTARTPPSGILRSRSTPPALTRSPSARQGYGTLSSNHLGNTSHVHEEPANDFAPRLR